ncbi:MALRD1 [Cordylochernes scorpioides]|uniref:MALRD1 n=1 Tax=Cordylochernes scorpioides TaxID=51811 RepID=A0ABY6KHH5_9ARAC|nr:MALRD1 [Cordylochernes scorpioides]
MWGKRNNHTTNWRREFGRQPEREVVEGVLLWRGDRSWADLVLGEVGGSFISVVENPCGNEHFTCSNSQCIKKEWWCDGRSDCRDNSDEARCGHTNRHRRNDSLDKSMELRQEQRVVIEFLEMEGCSASEIHKELKNVYKEATIDVSNVRRWIKDSDVVRILWMTNQVVGGHQQPPTLKTRLMTLYVMIEEKLSESYRKICSKWVPRKLTPDQRDQRVQLCQELLHLSEAQKDTF